ncbi:MAG: aldehyde ferredoxin oxidoreductase family protein [Candidatus Helarchaeota archaeon]
MSSNGYAGKLLKVNLSDSKITTEDISNDFIENLGGICYGAKLLYEMTNKGVDPLSPENPLIFLTGPITGTEVLMSGRHAVISKSPLTGIFGYAMCGGFFGYRLKRCGFDGIILEGKSSQPKSLLLSNDNAELIDASNMWGKNNKEVKKIIQEKYPKSHFLSIGTAGENQVHVAGIIDGDFRNHGRTGMGAVMGSKNLKSIIATGNKSIKVHDSAGIKELNKVVLESIEIDFIKKTLVDNYRKFGTGALFGLSHLMGNLGIKNWAERRWDDHVKICAQELHKLYVNGRYHCYRCFIGCGRTITGNPEVEDGAGPEYETMGALGSLILNDDPKALVELNHMCNDLGIDTISTGGIIAFIMECSEKGLIEEKVLWGDTEKIKELILKISSKEGIGALLSEGVKKASEKIPNSKEYAMNVKGMEIPMHDPRIGSMGLAYATATRGACHLQAQTAMKLLPMKEFKLTMSASAAQYIKINQDWNQVLDSLVMCKFGIYPQGPISISQVAKYYQLVTGRELGPNGLRRIGEKAFNYERLYDIREGGISSKDDTLNKRYLDSYKTFQEDLEMYYRRRNWTQEGIPRKGILKKRGIPIPDWLPPEN